MFDANPSDFRNIPFGMCASQLSIVRPTIRKGMPWWRKYAAIESPYGPAPMMAVFSMVLTNLSSGGREFGSRLARGFEQIYEGSSDHITPSCDQDSRTLQFPEARQGPFKSM